LINIADAKFIYNDSKKEDIGWIPSTGVLPISTTENKYALNTRIINNKRIMVLKYQKLRRMDLKVEYKGMILLLTGVMDSDCADI